ncbi:MAG: pyridoxamine 5'-phosphate oxidase [Chloroflexota bacterium]
MGRPRSIVPVRAEPRHLSETDLLPTPTEQLARWLDDATAAGVPLPRAMVLATASADGGPSARTVLLDILDERGLVFHTNLESPKLDDMRQNARAAVVFLWTAIQRQVRVVGRVEPASPQESLDYFESLPTEIRYMLWTCRQSDVIASRAELEILPEVARRTFPDGRVPLPAHWGGLRLIPTSFEFFQSRENWLQDRLRYSRKPDGWRIQRLVP